MIRITSIKIVGDNGDLLRPKEQINIVFRNQRQVRQFKKDMAAKYGLSSSSRVYMDKYERNHDLYVYRCGQTYLKNLLKTVRSGKYQIILAD